MKLFTKMKIAGFTSKLLGYISNLIREDPHARDMINSRMHHDYCMGYFNGYVKGVVVRIVSDPAQHEEFFRYGCQKIGTPYEAQVNKNDMFMTGYEHGRRAAGVAQYSSGDEMAGDLAYYLLQGRLP